MAILDGPLFFQCSEACGGGEQQRLVTCPEPGLCEELVRPNSTRPCNTHPCTQWVVGPWGQVSGVPWGKRLGATLGRCPLVLKALKDESLGMFCVLVPLWLLRIQ